MTKEEKAALIREQASSGLTQANFCAAKSISPKSFRQWKYAQRLADHGKPAFVELVAKPSPAMPLVIVAGRFRIEVPAGFDKAHLSLLLQSLPC